MRKDPRSSAPYVRCTSPSLQTSTLLCVKNLQAICGGCVLTCPGWMVCVRVWGRLAEEEARTAHSRPTKGLRCLAALQNQLGPFRPLALEPLQLPPISARKHFLFFEMKAWFYQLMIHLTLQIKLRNKIKVNQITWGYFVFMILFRGFIK